MTRRKRRKIIIYRGKFYSTFSTGFKAHPCLVFKVNRRKNKYCIVIFDTTPRDDRIELSVPIEPTKKKTYMHKRPVLVSHGDFGEKELIGLAIAKIDKPLIELVKRRKPLLSKKYRTFKTQKLNKNKKSLLI